VSDRLRDRIGFVTGGGSGIGAGTARLMAQEGADVAVVEHPSRRADAEAVADDVRQIGQRATVALADVTDEASVQGAFDAVTSELGVPDCIVASAGVAAHPDNPGFGGLLDIDTTHWQFVLDVNLNGVFFTLREGVRRMVDVSKPGSIVTLASVAAKIPTAGVYSVSKSGVWMLTRALALEAAPHGIRINSIGPGYVETPMLEDAARLRGGSTAEWFDTWAARVPLGRLGEPLDIALTALFLLSDDSRYLTGSLLHPDGGIAMRFAGG